MGCRICIEAPLETVMPLDLTVLLRSAPSATFGAYQTIATPPIFGCSYDNDTLVDTSGPPYGCRRVATFPLVNNHKAPKQSSMRYRSLSELTDLKLLTSASKYGAEAFSTMIDSKGNCKLLVPAEDKEAESEETKSNSESSDSKMIYLVRIRSRNSLCEELEARVDEPVSPDTILKRLKKKVAFADDRGMQLTTIRVMTEPSDVPPKINYSAIMRQLIGDDWSDEQAVAKPCATWVVNFKQPASDYLAFRQKLDSGYVALENLLVKNDHCRLLGTVKVKNICFEKQVFVRFTDNEWKSYYDRPCTYLTTKGRNSGGINDSFDTFQFDFEIACDDSMHQRMEFCVCYRTGNGQEYWDNNDGKNFEVISEHLRLQRNQIPRVNTGGGAKASEHQIGQSQATSDVANLNCKNWTEFASWNNLCDGNKGYW